MTEISFTPGPWKVFVGHANDSGYHPFSVCCPSGIVIADLAFLDPRAGGYERKSADLIAASPDLLDACQNALEEIGSREHVEACANDVMTPELCRLRNLKLKLSNAIYAATKGKQS